MKFKIIKLIQDRVKDDRGRFWNRNIFKFINLVFKKNIQLLEIQ